MTATQTSVLFVIDTPPELRRHLEQQLDDTPQLKLLFARKPEEAQYLKLAPEADVIVGWRVSPEVLAAAEKLKLYVFGGVGAQSVLKQIKDQNEARSSRGEQPITLVKCVANTYATAQHAVALFLALANKLTLHHNWMAEGHWRRGDDFAKSVTLRGLNIGLLGYGEVNRKVHRFLAGFDLRFSILRRLRHRETEWLPTLADTYSADQLARFLEASDVLFVGVPLTSNTTGMIGAAELGQLGSQGLLVNVARGGVVDEAALYAALRNGTIAGAAIDVWYDYRPTPDRNQRKYPYRPEHPFHELDNVVLSPHRAASPLFALERWDEVADHLRRFVTGQAPQRVVDLAREY
jgi:phosphoglycerate dehydrogenase-like enzyme